MEAGNLESKPKEVIQLATPLLPNIGTRRRDGISAMAAEEADHAEALRRIQEAEQTVAATTPSRNAVAQNRHNAN
jgi:hypothetical protein